MTDKKEAWQMNTEEIKAEARIDFVKEHAPRLLVADTIAMGRTFNTDIGIKLSIARAGEMFDALDKL